MSQSLAATSRALLRATVRPAVACLQVRFLSATTSSALPATATTTVSAPGAPSSSAPLPSEPLPYRVGRSASLNLSVYHRIKSGGSNKTTEIKKVEGDVRVLSQQLSEALGVETKINPRTNHIIIKGFHKDKVVSWLTEQGF